MTNGNNQTFCGGEEQARGLTKREYFAAMAMQGSVAADSEDQWTFADHARFAVKQADALIEALNKESK